VGKSQLTAKFIIGILLALFFGIALYLRICLPYDQVFSGEWIKFTSVDAYFHMRLVDNLVHNFPRLTSFDPYFIYPGGQAVGGIRFFDWLLAGLIWVIGLGAPTQHTVDLIGVYFPAILGALTIIPVYFIGKELFGRWAGVLSAGLISIAPGEFLGRSILGFTDQHIAEVLFSAIVILFLILAIKAARQKQLTFNHLKQRDWAISTKPIIYSLLAGIFLGIYLLTWLGALLLVFTISLYLILQSIIDHLKHHPTDYLGLIGGILFFIALVIFLPFSPKGFYRISLVIALLVPLILSSTSRLITSKGIKPAYYPLILLGIGLSGGAIFYALAPHPLLVMVKQFGIFVPTEVERTTIEMQPLLFPGGKFSTIVAWGNFTTGSYLSLVSLLLLIFYLVKKRGNAEKTLLVVWSVVILAATLGQRRFAYYFAVNVALLTSYFSVLAYYLVRFLADYLGGKSTDYMSWRSLELSNFEKLIVQPRELPTRAERKRAKLKGQEAHPPINYASISLWVIIIFFLAFYPNIGWATNTVKEARFAPTDAWMQSLSWLKENTPEPFGNPNFYYELQERPLPGESYEYPESAYGVMAWWDYGYWVTRIAHRLPNANPSQDPVAITNVASFFLSQDEDSAEEIIQKLDTSYIIIDYLTTTSKFWAIATWLGKEQTDFFDIYYLPEEGRLEPYFYPEYYRSLSVRLYNFDGKAVTPKNPVVISYQERVNERGIRYKEVISKKEFDSYEEAEAYLLTQDQANHKIVGTHPFISPVPLEALKNYKLVYSSEDGITEPAIGTIPEVKVFKYVGE
jgi:dolichyl-diphosphooligosaccharide--protein glycosyltransferase